MALNIVPPGGGTLVVSIEQRGISVIASLLEAGGDESGPAASAIERHGHIGLTSDSTRNVVVRVSSQDAKSIVGEVCTSAVVVDSNDLVRINAENTFAAAGRAVYSRKWNEAFRDYLKASRLFDKLEMQSRVVAARNSMAQLAYWQLYREHDSFALAADTRSSGLIRDAAALGGVDSQLALVLIDQPELNGINRALRAGDLLNRALQRLEGTPFAEREVPRIHIFKGALEYSENRPAEASKLFTQAAEACSALGDWQCYAQARQNNAVLAEEQKDFDFAMRVYEDALLALALVPSSPELSADIADNLGRLQARIGLFGRSEQSRKTAMQIYARIGNCAGARRSSASLGMLLMSVGSTGDASIYLDQAVSSRCPELLGAISTPSGALRNLAAESDVPTTARFDGSSSEAMQRAHCSVSYNLGTEGVDDKLAVFDAFVSLSNALLTEDDVQSAGRCIKLAGNFAVTPRAQVRLAYMTGMLNLRRRQALPASRAFTDALRIADQAGLPDTWVYRGFARLGLAQSALLAGRPEIARREALYELRMSSVRTDVSQIVASLRLLAGSYRDSNQIDAAIRTLRLAVNLIERVPIGELDAEKRATYLATQHDVFAELTELLLIGASKRETGVWDAFEISELGRARSLRYAVNQAALDNSGVQEDSPEVFRALLDRVKTLAESSKDPERLVQEIARIELDGYVPRQPFEAAQIVKPLEKIGATLVEFSAGERNMFAFVVDRGSIHVVRLGSVEAIARAAAKLNDRLRAPEPVPSHIRAAATELARLVIWPISSFISTERIIFVPDDALHTVPFAVLPWAENSRDTLLVHRAETTVLASALLLSKLVERQPSVANRFTLVGDPVFRAVDWRRECQRGAGLEAVSHSSVPQFGTSGEVAVARATVGDSLRPLSMASRAGTERSVEDWADSLRRLPGTRTEVLGIAQLVRESRPSSVVSTLIRCDATASALRNAADGNGGLLHIATHGRIDARRPRLSALALTPDRSAQGNAAFSLLDILSLKLHARLVVLSACDTSRGRLLPGEGVLGLAQAFRQAGAASVLASFWRVDDDATAAFMQRFYQHLIADRLPASAALRRAQLDQASTDSTYSWAAFSLYGSPDTSL